MTLRGSFDQARDFLILHRADYDHAYKNFAWPQASDFNWALDYFDKMAVGNNNPALWIIAEDGKEEKYSFADLSARSNQVANYMKKLGLKKGDGILLMLGNETARWEIMLAAIKLGVIIIPASPFLTPQEIEDRLLRGRARMIVTNKEHADRFKVENTEVIPLLVDGSLPNWKEYKEATQETAEFSRPEAQSILDTIFLYFASATTPKPKMVEHSHLSFAVGHLSTMYWMGLRPGDIHLGVSSPGWAMHDWNSFIAPWNAEATIFIDRLSRFNAKVLLDTMVQYKVTTFCAPPTVWRLLLQEDLKQYQVPLREALSTGEPLEQDIVDAVQSAWGVTIREGFGQTETTMLIGVTPSMKPVRETLGKPLPGYAIELLDSEGQQATVGEICITSPTLPQQPFHSGDIGKKNADGYYSYLGRNDELFKSSDYRISPFEIEAVLRENPAVREVAVIPSADPIRYSVPKAIVVLAKGIEPTKEIAIDLMNFTRSRLAPFKRVRRIEFHDLSKDAEGNLLRFDMIKRETEKRNANEKSPYEFWEEDARASLPETWAQDLP